MNRKLLVVALFLVFVARPYQAQTSSAQSAAVDALFAKVTAPDGPGCAVGVIRDGRMIFARAYGLANLEFRIPLTSATIFDPASMAKQFTAASVLLLAHDGKLSLDDNVRKFIPELPVYERPITVRHLLYHTSGVRDYPSLFAMKGIDSQSAVTEEQTLALLARQTELNFTPGTQWMYSNSGYFLLAVVVKRVSGKSLRDFAQERLFTPLGMKHTQFVDDNSLSIPNRATNYGEKEDGSHYVATSMFQPTGDANILTTLGDLLLWDQNYYTGKVGGSDFGRELQTPGASADGEPLDYAFGLFVHELNGLKVVEHGGDGSGVTAYMSRFPEQRLTAMCLCNRDPFNTGEVVHQLAAVFLPQLMSKKSPTASGAAGLTLSAAERGHFVGLYRSPATDFVRRIREREGRLIIEFPPAGTLELVARDHLRTTDGPVTADLFFDPSGRRFRMERAGRPMDTYERVDDSLPTPAELQSFAGLYYSNDIEMAYNVVVSDGKLRLSNLDITLSPLFRDTFSGSGARVAFWRDGKGKVQGFRLRVGYTSKVRFDRIMAPSSPPGGNQ